MKHTMQNLICSVSCAEDFAHNQIPPWKWAHEVVENANPNESESIKKLEPEADRWKIPLSALLSSDNAFILKVRPGDSTWPSFMQLGQYTCIMADRNE